MAEVWLCKVRDQELAKAAEGPYCVAKLSRDNVKRREELLKQEVSINYHLRKHPNVAKILGFNHEAHAILVKFYELGSLDTLIHKGRQDFQWSVKMRRNFILDIARGVQHMHNCSIVHQDLKPANVLLQYQGKRMMAVITDFGISQLLDGKENVVSGFELRNLRGLSIAYASPNCIHRFLQREKGLPEELKADDVYSVASMLYEIITHHYPWR